MYTGRKQQQAGAVSLFVVVFATLLMVIITISFIQLMLKDQQQATVSDLSQSAYDSALAGVEDAKRLLLMNEECYSASPPTEFSCDAVKAALASGECNTVAAILGDKDADETIVQQDAGDDRLDQAYTCVKINVSTEDYKGIADVNQSSLIPLRSASTFNKVRISWFTQDDVGTVNPTIGFPGAGPVVQLPEVANWPANNPALLRTQFMYTGASFKLSDYDAGNANTLFLYPVASGSSTTSFAVDKRRDATNSAPELADCKTTFSDQYACQVTIDLPAAIDSSVPNRSAMLRLSALYNGAHYKIELLDAAGLVQKFDRVQPEVDSTGRANDMFRRVKSRIEFKSDFIYPEAAVDIEGDLCKNFIVTNSDSDYATTACAP
jgi:Tfp pilus assembly protein PilX